MCVCVCVINHVPGFTAAQGHHFQPYHRSAGDSFIPDQQKVRHSQGPQAVGRVLQRSVSPQSPPLCSSLTGVSFSHLQSFGSSADAQDQLVTENFKLQNMFRMLFTSQNKD